MERTRILLLDAAPGRLLDRELERLLGHGLEITLNLRRVTDPAGARAAWAGRVAFTDFDLFDESAVISETVRGGLGHHAVKSRAGVPLRADFLAAATGPALAHRLRVIGRAGAGTDHVDLDAAARHGVAVTHTPGSNATAVAEFALAQLLALVRNLPAYDEASHRGRWSAPAAAVDTFAHEHAAFTSPLFGLPGALLTPHVAGMTEGAMAEAALRCADHIAALLAGRPDGVPVVGR
ncbi:hypothetical protein [Streptomyces radiopugnans]|uniref:D-3-phosphoglycerate dehydrogenase n=1 Tax=Streptomyces radiopugnans TaxID=403935 RepID=A0A1H9DJC8_9ACTN|nr:hypothetical protein [Streptomyces radiopugnans]SEQ12863.1 D-3-phosphoglycerate dehydrogenase [Streptomyces radiopugnans]